MVRVIRWVLTVLTCLFGALFLVAAIRREPAPLAALMPAIIAVLGATGLWIEESKRRRWDRRLASGRCPSCGYDRGGHAHDSPCPECGLIHKPALSAPK
jgi:hypothetical protein